MSTIVHIRSADLSYGDPSTGFRVELKRPLPAVSQFTLLDAQIPSTWYSFPGGTLVTSVGSITLPAGNFTASSLAAYLQTTGLATLNPTSVTYDPDFNRFVVVLPASIQFGPSGTANALLGLSTTAVLAGVSSAAGWSYTFPNAPVLYSIDAVWITLGNVQGKFESTGGVQAHFRLPQQGGSNALNFYSAASSVYNVVALPAPQAFTYFTVYLLKPDGTALDLRGHDFSFTLLAA